jgi:hypothetical protein
MAGDADAVDAVAAVGTAAGGRNPAGDPVAPGKGARPAPAGTAPGLRPGIKEGRIPPDAGA